jgi:hypothetical protein
MINLIKSGGGTGPMKPGNRFYTRCQFQQSMNALKDKKRDDEFPSSYFGRGVF